MKENDLYILIIASGIVLTIQFFIIKLAVASAMNNLENKIDKLVNLKILELKDSKDIIQIKKATGYEKEVSKIEKSGVMTVEDKKEKIREIEKVYL